MLNGCSEELCNLLLTESKKDGNICVKIQKTNKGSSVAPHL